MVVKIIEVLISMIFNFLIYVFKNIIYVLLSYLPMNES